MALIPALHLLRRRYRRVADDVGKAKYKLLIDYNYPVTVFKGTKGIVITTTSWMGGKNPFLGICYLVVGGLMLLFTVVFLLVQRCKGRYVRQRPLGQSLRHQTPFHGGSFVPGIYHFCVHLGSPCAGSLFPLSISLPTHTRTRVPEQ